MNGLGEQITKTVNVIKEIVDKGYTQVDESITDASNKALMKGVEVWGKVEEILTPLFSIFPTLMNIPLKYDIDKLAEAVQDLSGKIDELTKKVAKLTKDG